MRSVPGRWKLLSSANENKSIFFNNGIKIYTGYSMGENSVCLIYHIVMYGCESGL